APFAARPPGHRPSDAPRVGSGRHGADGLPRARGGGRRGDPGVTLRIETDLDKIEQNTRILVDRLASTGIRVTGITKAVLGSPGVGAAMLRGGARGLGDSRVPNLARLSGLDRSALRTLIRSPMLSQVARVVDVADVSLNTEAVVLAALDQAASQHKRMHAVVLMVELGDLREGIALDDAPAAVRA